MNINIAIPPAFQDHLVMSKLNLDKKCESTSLISHNLCRNGPPRHQCQKNSEEGQSGETNQVNQISRGKKIG